VAVGLEPRRIPVEHFGVIGSDIVLVEVEVDGLEVVVQREFRRPRSRGGSGRGRGRLHRRGGGRRRGRSCRGRGGSRGDGARGGGSLRTPRKEEGEKEQWHHQERGTASLHHSVTSSLASFW